MEEDIKILQKALKVLKGKDTKLTFGFEETAQAIENLIKGYRELEEENYRQRSQLMSAFDRGFIHKSKVREKIEELYEDKDNKYYDMFLEQRDIEKTISILKELMEDK